VSQVLSPFQALAINPFAKRHSEHKLYLYRKLPSVMAMPEKLSISCLQNKIKRAEESKPTFSSSITCWVMLY
jgi:hypothetical protein